MTDETLGAPDAFEPPADDSAQASRIQQFWEEARSRAGMGKVGAVVGLGWGESVPPEAWSFGDSPELADELLALVLDGTKTGTAASLWEYDDEGEPVPEVGSLSIVLDGAGEPRALLRTTAVEVVPFDEVTEEHAHSEGEDDRTLESWRREHEKYWRRVFDGGEREFAPDMPVVCERFEVLYPKR